MRHGPRQKCRPALRDINHVLRRRREQARDYLPLAVVRHSSSSRFGRLGRVLLPSVYTDITEVLRRKLARALSRGSRLSVLRTLSNDESVSSPRHDRRIPRIPLMFFHQQLTVVVSAFSDSGRKTQTNDTRSRLPLTSFREASRNISC